MVAVTLVPYLWKVFGLDTEDTLSHAL